MRGLAPNVTTTSALDRTQPLEMRNYVVVVTDPENDWRSAYMTVSASSRDDAKERARGQLAVTRRDHWSVEIVVEAT